MNQLAARLGQPGQLRLRGVAVHLIAVSGTSGTVQIRWVFNGTPMSAWNDRTLVSGGCAGNFTNYQVGATVTDATGSTSARGVLTCRTGPWT